MERTLPVHPWLLEILACPECKAEVRPTEDGSWLVCASCRRRYAVVDDVPNMLVEEATLPGEARPRKP